MDQRYRVVRTQVIRPQQRYGRQLTKQKNDNKPYLFCGTRVSLPANESTNTAVGWVERSDTHRVVASG